MSHSLYIRFTAVLTSLFLISACGFHLKGQYRYAFNRLYITSSAQTSQFMRAHLKQMITAGSHTVVVDDPSAADAILTLDVRRSRSSKSLGSHGAAEEYALEMVVDYQLKDANGALLLGPDRLVLQRSMTYNTQYALAKAIESEQIYRDIENDAVDQLLRRLASVRDIKTD